MKRRERGDGSLVYEEARQRWKGSFYDSRGKRRYVYGKKGETKNQVNQRLKAKIAEDARGELVDVQKKTVEEYLTEWLTETRRLGYRANSYRSRESALKKIIPVLGSIQIQKLTRRHVQQWINKMADAGLAPATIDNYYGAFHAALEDAVKDQVIAKNPATGTTLPPIESAERPVLDLAQAQKLLQELEGHRWLRPIILLALATGLRKVEILALRWSDVDLTKGVLYVRHNFAHVRGGIVEGPPKTKSSERPITLPAFALDMLFAQRAKVDERKQLAKSWQEKDLVFPNRTGGFILPFTVDKSLKSTLKKSDLPDISFHRLRHSAASLLLSMGVPPKVVQSILGHASITMTMDLYGHLFPGQQDSAMQMLHTAFSEGGQEVELSVNELRERYQKLRQIIERIWARLTPEEQSEIAQIWGISGPFSGPVNDENA